jgi:L,D-transpeptidase YbiS
MSDVPQSYIEVSLRDQRLILWDAGRAVFSAAVSTAKNGPGERRDSECTPRGSHRIHAKIGADSPPNTVFVGRRATGEVYAPALRGRHPDRDWILTRILWLTGEEPGINLHGDVDTLQRYIYIHGSPDDVAMGTPASRGCIRMRNEDIIRLFDLVEEGTHVVITE